MTKHIGQIGKLVLSFIAFVLTTVLVTQALEDRIYFSLFLGIPAGFLTFIITFSYLSFKPQLKKDK